MNTISEETSKPEFKAAVERELKRCLRYQNFASLILLNVSADSLSGDSNFSSQIPAQKLMTLIQRELRETDIIDSQGNDLIAVLLLYSDKRIAQIVGNRLRTSITNYVGIREGLGSPKVYLGGACFPSHATDYGALYARAQHIVEKAKSIGEDQIPAFE